MKTFPHLVLCEHCDSVYERPTLAPGETARCDVCGATLCRGSTIDLERWLALAIAAGIADVIANVCPVVRISMQGLHNEATLWQSTAALAHGAIAMIAVPTAFAIIVAPFVQIVLLIWVLAYAHAGRCAPFHAPAMRLLVALRPWSMVEVALLGILVSAIKLAGLVQVVPGAGIWATAALMVLLTLIATRDLHDLWDLHVPGQTA